MQLQDQGDNYSTKSFSSSHEYWNVSQKIFLCSFHSASGSGGIQADAFDIKA